MAFPLRAPAALLALGLTLAACGGPAAKPAPVLLLCVDGLEPELVQRFLAEGSLPTLARFAEQGTLGSLETQLPTWSPVLWTTIATGQGLREHGVVGFLEPTSGLPYTSNARRVPALWNLVGEAGLEVDTVGYWVTWPAEAVSGRMVASYAAQAQAQVIWKPGLWRSLARQTHPEELLEEIATLITFTDQAEAVAGPLRELTGLSEAPAAHEEKLLIDLAWTLMGDRSYAGIAERFLRQDPADLTLVYLSLPDVAGHRFWRYLFPEQMGYPVADEDVRRLGGVIQRAYAETDRQLGRLIAAAPAGSNVLLVSDHGMHRDIETLQDPTALTSGHHQTGPSGLFGALGAAFAARGPCFDAGNPRGLLGDIRGVAPLVLRLLGQRVPEHWPFARPGNPLEELLTPAFAADRPRRFRASPDEAWRAAHPPSLPIDPGPAMNAGFLEAFIRLGYLNQDGKPRDPAPEPR
jgi:hypothetical protein